MNARPQMPPTHNIFGLNMVDPHDRNGRKLSYINQVHTIALRTYYPRGQGLAVDVGCGFGRLTGYLRELGYSRVIGIDPDPALVEFARQNTPGVKFLQGGLPDLPIPPASAELLVLHNVLRPLKQLDHLEKFQGVRKFLQPHGTIVVVDNIWLKQKDYWHPEEIESLFTRNGLRIHKRTQLRGGRWWLGRLYAAGLLPKSLGPKLAELEIRRRARAHSYSRWQYINTLWILRAE